jgi:hypothetical protein
LISVFRGTIKLDIKKKKEKYFASAMVIPKIKLKKIVYILVLIELKVMALRCRVPPFLTSQFHDPATLYLRKEPSVSIG